MVKKAATKPDTVERIRKRSCNYSLTWNNPTDDDIKCIEYNLNHHDKIIGQLEIGKTGVTHIQFTIGYNNPTEFNTVQTLYSKCHVEPTKWIRAQLKYCSKLKTRLRFLIKLVYKVKIIEMCVIDVFYYWQKKILQLVDEKPHPRKIHWFWESIGCSGKTTFSIWLFDRYNCIYLSSGRENDIVFNFKSQYDKLEDDENTIVIFDLPRSLEDHISYAAIEKIKNGIICSNKYESCTFRFNIPHIIVFANFEPQKEQLSKDRWRIHEITDNEVMTEP